jgi:hypothetical protein
MTLLLDNVGLLCRFYFNNMAVHLAQPEVLTKGKSSVRLSTFLQHHIEQKRYKRFNNKRRSFPVPVNYKGVSGTELLPLQSLFIASMINFSEGFNVF